MNLFPNDVAHLGQVFTPELIVDTMLSLRRNQGKCLEPAAGDGAFSRRIPGCLALEIDPSHAPPGALIKDFFDFPTSERFHTIIGNPPYVRHQDILPATRQRLSSQRFDGRSNLYLFFIEKAVQHLLPGGELIFITPRDFLKATSARNLNRWLFTQGSITDAIDLGDARIFDGALPNCLIWRFEKDSHSRQMRYAALGVADKMADSLRSIPWEARIFNEASGHLYFSSAAHGLTVKDCFSVKVGAVSGADEIYASDLHGNRDFVCSHTASSGQTRRMIWQAPGSKPHPALLPHKERLISRGIRPFDESNWWLWGRGYPETDAPRIYVNNRTRQHAPFFLHPCCHFDGAVLALFPHRPDADLSALCALLNSVDWAEHGFVCDGRFLFTQRSLQNAPLPETFRGAAVPPV